MQLWKFSWSQWTIESIISICEEHFGSNTRQSEERTFFKIYELHRSHRIAHQFWQRQALRPKLQIIEVFLCICRETTRYLMIFIFFSSMQFLGLGWPALISLHLFNFYLKSARDLRSGFVQCKGMGKIPQWCDKGCSFSLKKAVKGKFMEMRTQQRMKTWGSFSISTQLKFNPFLSNFENKSLVPKFPWESPSW